MSALRDLPDPNPRSHYAARRTDERRYHIAYVTRTYAIAACDTDLELDRTTVTPADLVSDAQRCQQSGCREMWPTEN